MESNVVELILLTLPENLKEQGAKLIEVTRIAEEERHRDRSHKYRRHRMEIESEAAQAKRKDKIEKSAIPIAVARLIIELWSTKMRRHAEQLILQKGVVEGYLKEHHVKLVHVLEDSEEREITPDKDWLIDNQDEAIIQLVWEIFDMKTHFSQVSSHRSWVQRSYDRLRSFVPTLSAEIVERHDLSKYAFSQAVGYTLKWVHSAYHQIWKTACDFHLFNEPHHPQVWSKTHNSEEKRKKLQKWMSFASDAHTGCPYGLDIANLDLTSEDFAEPFLLESYIDMVGVEWERKKGMDINIPLRRLAYIDDKFLVRYTKKQHQVISNLIEEIVAADESWKSISLTERERVLMSALPWHKHAIYACQVELQKEAEEKRLTKSILKEIGDTVGAVTQPTEDDIKMAHDTAFYIMVARVVMEHWTSNFRKHAQDLIIQKAIDEKQIKKDYYNWIVVFEDKSDKGEGIVKQEASGVTVADDELVKLLWDEFKLNKHFTQVQQHRHWVKQSYLRLAAFMPELSEEMIERHDLTKLAMAQSMGYTLKWIHEINFPVWRKSCDVHLNFEPHHPQMWSNKHSIEHKQNCLENWLSAKTIDSSYGVIVSTLDLRSENMAKVFLLESLVDMVAVEWERNKNQKLDLTYKDLIYMEERFLSRYSESDKSFLLELMSVISKAD